jgi:hypothetical protein
MIPATILIPIIGSAVKLLAAGRAPDSGEWSGAVSSILAALVAQGNETNATLSRIEAKLDRLALQDFQHSYGAALNLLEEAMPEWRERAERERLIAEARNRLSDALAAAPDPLGKAVIEWYIGVAWLLSRSVPDCDRAMRRAADDGLAALLEVAEGWSPSPHSADFQQRVKGLETGINRVERWFTGGKGSASAQLAAGARGQLRRELAPRAREAETAFRAIQKTREALGLPPGACRPVRLWPYLQGDLALTLLGVPGSSLYGDLQLIVDLDDASRVRLGGVEVGVTAVERLPGTPAGRWSLVDAEVALAGDSRDEPWRFSLCALRDEGPIFASGGPGGSYRLPEDPITLGAPGRAFLASTADGAGTGPPLPGQHLIAGEAFYPAEGTVSLEPGQSSRGWVRFAIEGVPAAVVITPLPGGPPLHFIRPIG